MRGAPTVAAALLAGKTIGGGAPVPAALGPDPCAGKASGTLVPWRAPDGRTPLTWAAAVPMYTFSDLLQVLAPNGRSSGPACERRRAIPAAPSRRHRPDYRRGPMKRRDTYEI